MVNLFTVVDQGLKRSVWVAVPQQMMVGLGWQLDRVYDDQSHLLRPVGLLSGRVAKNRYQCGSKALEDIELQVLDVTNLSVAVKERPISLVGKG